MEMCRQRKGKDQRMQMLEEGAARMKRGILLAYTQFFYKRQSGLVTSCVSKKIPKFD